MTAPAAKMVARAVRRYAGGMRPLLFLIDLTGRALGVIHGQNVPNDLALQGVLGVGVPF